MVCKEKRNILGVWNPKNKRLVRDQVMFSHVRGKFLHDFIKEHANNPKLAQKAGLAFCDKNLDYIQINYKDLYLQSGYMANYLQNVLNLKLGTRVLLLLPYSPLFFVGFLGCLRSGIIPIPIVEWQLRHKGKIKHIVDDAQLTLGITSSHFKNKLPNVEGVKWKFLPDNFNEKKYQVNYTNKKLKQSDIAFLQYTSGSTTQPKGVIIRHQNLINNLWLVKMGNLRTSSDVEVSWLPHTHDMGLITTILSSIYCGSRVVLMQPLDFVSKPWTWLQLVSSEKATNIKAPNFAFDLLTKRWKDKYGPLDLSCLKMVWNAAEPARKSTIASFVNKFKKYGLDPDGLRIGYGLAETVVAVSISPGNPKTYGEKASGYGMKVSQWSNVYPILSLASMICCGIDVRIVKELNGKFIECDDEEEGEIWIQSASVCSGYWNKPKESKKIFQARIDKYINNRNWNWNTLYSTQEKKEDQIAELKEMKETMLALPNSYLRTGDLGFTYKGCAYITGRLKDLIIIRGRNVYPQDIEEGVEESVNAVRNGCSVAFGMDVDKQGRIEESVVYVAELRPRKYTQKELDILKNEMSSLIFQQHNVETNDIKFVYPRCIPKTTSGKIQRQKTKRLYMLNKLREITLGIKSNI